MKVNGAGRVRASTPKRVGKSSGAGGQVFSVENEQSSQEIAAGSAPSAIATIDSLLALQEVNDPIAGRRKAVKRAYDILDTLDTIRLGLMNGSLPASRLRGLIDLVESRRDNFEDPALSTLIDEVELRARVEIAKLEKIKQ